MEYLIMAYGRDFEPMAEIFCDSYMILEFYAMSTCWPNVQWSPSLHPLFFVRINNVSFPTFASLLVFTKYFYNFLSQTFEQRM